MPQIVNTQAILNYLSNEENAGLLVNATSAGDAGGRSDHFVGTSLAAYWGNSYGTGVANAVKNSTLAITNTAGANTDTGYHGAYTPTAAFRIEARIILGEASGVNSGVEAASSTTPASADTFGVSGGGTSLTFFTRDAGSYTSRATATITASQFVYIALKRDGSNNVSGHFSYDRNTWIQIGTFAKTFTVAYIKLNRFTLGTTNGGFDFVDVVS